MRTLPALHRFQTGVMLLEALLAILIFSIGVLAIVGMQASAVQDMSEAKYRMDAAFLADQVLADMWGNTTDLDNYAYPGGGTPPANIAAWVSTVNARLPGSTDFPPIIAVDPNPNNPTKSRIVTITVRWRAARERGISAAAHGHRVINYITWN